MKQTNLKVLALVCMGLTLGTANGAADFTKMDENAYKTLAAKINGNTAITDAKEAKSLCQDYLKLYPSKLQKNNTNGAITVKTGTTIKLGNNDMTPSSISSHDLLNLIHSEGGADSLWPFSGMKSYGMGTIILLGGGALGYGVSIFMNSEDDDSSENE